jgi:beta-galactosidase
MKKNALTCAALLGAGIASYISPGCAQERQNIALTSLDIKKGEQGWGKMGIGVSVEGKPLTIAGKIYPTGWGTHSKSDLYIKVEGAKRFSSWVGVDDETAGAGTVNFQVIGDGKVLWQSGVMKGGEPAKWADVDLKGVKYLRLLVDNAGDNSDQDHADWAEAKFIVEGKMPETVFTLPSQKGSILPGKVWLDTAGKPIQAHGGGILTHNGKYYWYGEDRSNGYVAIGVSGYVSTDLVNWKPMGVVLPNTAYNQKWKENTINERPKVIYNPRTKKFVMWFHYDKGGYGDSQAGVAIADKPEGPFKFLGMHRPVVTSTYRDMNLFVDSDGSAYSLYAGEENGTMHIVKLNDDYTLPQMPMVEGKTWSRILVDRMREAPAPFKYKNKYYLITSGCTGWAPNPGGYAVADSMLGPWQEMGNPFVGADANTTFQSQSTYVLPMPGKEGQFIYMGDRWKPSDLADSRYIWLPFAMKKDGTFEIAWKDEWKPGK